VRTDRSAPSNRFSRGSGRRRQRVRQQSDQRLELHIGRRGLPPNRQRSGGKPCPAVDQLSDPRVDGLRSDDAPRGDGLCLTDAVAAVNGLRLLASVRELGKHDVGGDLQVDTNASGCRGAHRDGDVGVIDEGVDLFCRTFDVWSPRIDE
jgi:hypothetical protein